MIVYPSWCDYYLQMINSFKKNFAAILLKWFPLLLFTIVTGSFSSCTTSRNSAYFKNISRDTVLTTANLLKEELKIQKGDILNLSVSSLNKEEDALYNSISAAAAGYEVDNNGEIHVHHLGKINVLGLTRKQLKIKLEKELDPYLKDPVVIVSFANHHITIIGSVGNPQILPMPNEKVSIIDALANSGSMVPFTNLSNVIVIRDSTDDKKQIRQVNLEDNSVFNSEFFYLKPNDVVVVKPDEKELQKQQKRTDYQQVSSIVLQTITISLIIYNTFFRK